MLARRLVRAFFGHERRQNNLMRLQLRIAQGQPLGLRQADVRHTGHAIEMRVYAEDPGRMLPSPGTITEYVEPRGEGIRVDSGVTTGSVVSHFYDPLLAKLVVHASTRDEAIERGLWAIDEFHILGVKTNLAVHRHVLASPLFGGGDYTTAILESIGPVPAPAAVATSSATGAARP